MKLLTITLASLTVLSVIAIMAIRHGRTECERIAADMRDGNPKGSVPAGRTGGTAPVLPVPPYHLGDDGEDLPPLTTADVIRNEPSLYAELISPSTPAERRREVEDMLTGMGYEVPCPRVFTHRRRHGRNS